MGKIKFLLVAILLEFLFTAPLVAQPQSSAEKIRMVYSAVGSSQNPLWIAQEAGLFNSIDVEFLYVAI